MLINVYSAFESLCKKLSERVRIEQESNLWAVIIDGETITWSITEQKARDFAIKWIKLERNV